MCRASGAQEGFSKATGREGRAKVQPAKNAEQGDGAGESLPGDERSDVQDGQQQVLPQC